MFFLMHVRPLRSALFPYTTLFRSVPVPSTWGTAAPAISRVAVVPQGGSTIYIYLASKSGPASGDASTADTDVFKANTAIRSEEHTSELQSHVNLVCRLLLEKKNIT